jgi:hypothetical protein
VTIPDADIWRNWISHTLLVGMEKKKKEKKKTPTPENSLVLSYKLSI